jgi:DNA polymerase-3 subunit delta'
LSFKDVYDQDRPIAVLKRSMAEKRVPHAFLFYGLKGVGKKTTALDFAKALNCERENAEACDQCSSCRKIDSGNHPDVINIESEGPIIKIGDIRNLQNQMKFLPLEGKKRVILVIDAEKMNIAAANSFLKTLEEPSPVNVIILITSRPYQLPTTILSRCHPLRFGPVGRDAIARYLADKRSVDAAKAMLIASSCGGSIGRALELHDGDYLALRDAVTKGITNGLSDPMECLAFAADFGKDRDEINERFEILRSWYRDILVYKEAGEAGDLIHRDRLDAIRSMAEATPVKKIIKAVKILDWAAHALEKNANRQLTLETMAFKLLQ